MMSMTSGVPQCSILGSLLFIIYWNDIHNSCNKFRTISFADGSNLIRTLCPSNVNLKNNFNRGQFLTHGGRVTHIYVGNLTIIGSDNGLSPGRRHAIIRTNAGILLIGTLGTNFSEILSEIHTFSLKKMHFKMSFAKWRPFCLGLNALISINSELENIQIWFEMNKLSLNIKKAKFMTFHSNQREIGHYPMLRADSRFWLVNNREIWSRISRLTSSAWDIKTKERHWWRHNGDSDRRPLSLPLRYDLVTLCLYGDLAQINVIAGILKLRKRFRMSQI